MEKFCSQCGTPLTTKFDGGRERPACPSCDHIVYGRFSLGTGGLLIHDGKILLIQRGEEPGKGFWTLPGGYVEADETPDEGVVREVWEETGLRTKVMGLFCIRHYAGERQHGIYYVFTLELAGVLEELREEGDGSEIEQAGLFSPQELDSLGQIGGISRWVIEHYEAKSAIFSRLPYDMGANKRYKGMALFGAQKGS
jgi:ADP-ribose pyrophosphatase YjhB (NUDIX family)